MRNAAVRSYQIESQLRVGSVSLPAGLAAMRRTAGLAESNEFDITAFNQYTLLLQKTNMNGELETLFMELMKLQEESLAGVPTHTKHLIQTVMSAYRKVEASGRG